MEMSIRILMVTGIMLGNTLGVWPWSLDADLRDPAVQSIAVQCKSSMFEALETNLGALPGLGGAGAALRPGQSHRSPRLTPTGWSNIRARAAAAAAGRLAERASREVRTAGDTCPARRLQCPPWRLRRHRWRGRQATGWRRRRGVR